MSQFFPPALSTADEKCSVCCTFGGTALKNGVNDKNVYHPIHLQNLVGDSPVIMHSVQNPSSLLL